MSIEYNKFLAEVSGVLDNYYDEIEWISLAKIFNLYDEIRYANEYECIIFDSDVIVNNIYHKDKYLLNDFLNYISYRYDIKTINEIIQRYFFIFNEDMSEKFSCNSIEKNTLNMFISYSTNDSFHALKVQKYFEKGDIAVFLSENKLKPSDEYKNKIYEEIYSADIFFYVLSENSNSSDWCNQEMGMAFLKYKLDLSKIFILRVDETLPNGFLNGFQAESIKKEGYLKRIAEEIDNYYGCDIIATIHEKDLNLKINKLYSVNSFNEAGNLLMDISNESLFLNENQLEKICEASLNNNQIYNARKCKKPLNIILKDNKEFIEGELYQSLFQKINN